MATKISIVTGGAQGVGKAFAGLLLEDGYKVSLAVMSARNEVGARLYFYT